MMEKRLRLAKRLLTHSGVLIDITRAVLSPGQAEGRKGLAGCWPPYD